MSNTTLEIPLHALLIRNHISYPVNARELHAGLQIGKDFATWLKGRIIQYRFEENQDFILLPNSGEQNIDQDPRGGHNRINCALTLDMAKELCMLERSELGRQARRYFLQCEAGAHKSQAQLNLLRQDVLKFNPLWGNIKAFKDKDLTHLQIAKLLDCRYEHIRKQVRLMETRGLLTPPDNLDRLQANALRNFGH